MWQASASVDIKADKQAVWNFLVRPQEWTKADPEHYKKVDYRNSELEVGSMIKMKAEKSPAIKVRIEKLEPLQMVVTSSGIPAGRLTITRVLSGQDGTLKLTQMAEAKGPLAGVFAKLVLDKQIGSTLPTQLDRIKNYIEKG